MKKKLSVITIVLNDRIGLRKTMQSVFSQSYKEFEYIIIDGASTDGSLDEIKSNANRIDKWVSEKDSGIYNAFNKAIRMAEGDYCIFLNAGDVLQSNDVFQKMMQEADGKTIVYGNMIIEDDSGGNRLGKMPYAITFHHMIADTLWHPVSFIPRSLFEKFGLYDEEFRIAGDYDFFLRAIIVHDTPTKYIDLPVVIFNLRGLSSDEKNKAILKQERRKSQEKYFPKRVIESAEMFNVLRNSKLFKLASLLKLT